jgi:hypothetical protein
MDVMPLESPSVQIVAENGILTITSRILEAYVLIQRFSIHLLLAK